MNLTAHDVGQSPPTTPTAVIIRDQAGLDALAEEWADLYAEIPAVTPFQSHAWVSAWSRAYCRPGRLRVVVVHVSGRLVALAPLWLTRRGGVPVLTTLGGSISDYSDLLIPPDAGPDVGQAIVEALLAEPGWHVLELPELRPDAAARKWSESWPGRVSRLAGSISLELPAQPLPTLLGRLPGRSAKVIRRKLRKLDDLGVRDSTVEPAGVADAVTSMLRLHEEQWRDRGIHAEHLTPRFAAHLSEALPRMVSERQALVVQYHLDGQLVAAQLDLIGHRFLGSYLPGVSPALKEKVDVASMLLRTDLVLAVAAGVPGYSMLRGAEDYKSHFRPTPVHTERILLGRPRTVGSLTYPTAARARKALVGWAKEHTPWLEGVHRKVLRWRTFRSS